MGRIEKRFDVLGGLLGTLVDNRVGDVLVGRARLRRALGHNDLADLAARRGLRRLRSRALLGLELAQLGAHLVVFRLLLLHELGHVRDALIARLELFAHVGIVLF